MIDLRTYLANRAGMATRAQLRTVGVSNRRIAAEVSRGRLITVGRKLVALPNCRPELIRAAAMGAKVACVTAARVRGLWALDDGRFHVTVGGNHGPLLRDDRAPRPLVHWTRHPIDRADHPALESGRNMLAHIARCQPLDLAVATFDSAVNGGFITMHELEALADVHRGPLLRVVPFVDGAADSGLESIMRVRLVLKDVRVRLQVRIDGHRVDILIGDWLVIQCDGFEFHRDRWQHERDLRQDNRLELTGYTVLRYGYTPVVFGWEAVETEILGAMALGRHLAPNRPRTFGRNADHRA